MIKFTKKLDDFRYCLSFDLAKHITGWSLVDFRKKTVLAAGNIDTTKSTEYIWSYYAKCIGKIFKQCSELLGDNVVHMFVTKEKLPNQAGKFTTVATLQALAQAHAVFDLCLIKSGFEYYDLDGVHAASEKAYFRALTGIETPSKDDIYKKIGQIFVSGSEKIYNYDISDSIAVTMSLIYWKFDRDIDERIKELKKESKKYKSDKKLSEISSQISFLDGLRNNFEQEIT